MKNRNCSRDKIVIFLTFSTRSHDPRIILVVVVNTTKKCAPGVVPGEMYLYCWPLVPSLSRFTATPSLKHLRGISQGRAPKGTRVTRRREALFFFLSFFSTEFVKFLRLAQSYFHGGTRFARTQRKEREISVLYLRARKRRKPEIEAKNVHAASISFFFYSFPFGL